MNSAERFEAVQTELKHLRSEMELNRKYIFERPLLIVVAGITAAAGASDLGGFDALPVAFVAILAYNLSFTFNRLQSNARIIAYMQLVHTPLGLHRWGGWEADLQRFRCVPASERQAITTQHEGSPKPWRTRFFRFMFRWIPVVKRAAVAEASKEDSEPRENRFYGPIFVFHLIAGVAITALLLAQVYPEGLTKAKVDWPQIAALTADIAALVVFAISSANYRPSKVRHTIAISRDIWDMKVLPPAPADAA